MHPQVLEGTWEEVSRHAAELRGKRVRLMVLPDEGTRAPEQMMFFGMFEAERESTAADFESTRFLGDPDDGLAWK